MTKQQAKQWVRDHDDQDEMDSEELREAFRALYGRDPDEQDEQWSLCCAAVEG